MTQRSGGGRTDRSSAGVGASASVRGTGARDSLRGCVEEAMGRSHEQETLHRKIPKNRGRTALRNLRTFTSWPVATLRRLVDGLRRAGLHGSVHIVDPKITEYLTQLVDEEDAVRREMEALAKQRRFPIVGPIVGRTLEVLARAIGARRVFELGSGYGYSALHFARAVGEAGVVHCTELSEDNVRLAEGFLGRAGVWSRVVYHREEATAALRRVGGTWDIVYNDVDKEGYPACVDLAWEHLRLGGLFITDNVLWSGRILPGESDGSPATAGVIEFTRLLLAHRGFRTCFDPTRDGVAIAVKI
jgi:predicted O-methyltransferase YrrM